MTRNTFFGLCIAITALPVSVRSYGLGRPSNQDGKANYFRRRIERRERALVLGIIIEMQQDGGNWRSYLQSVAWILAKSLSFMAAVFSPHV